MPTPFPIHDETTAPTAAAERLTKAKAGIGFIPNLWAIMAEAPTLLEGYQNLANSFSQTSLSPAEQQTVLMTANFENNCDYCVAHHSVMSQQAGIKGEELEKLRAGADLADPKLAALQRFARSLIRSHGNPVESDLDAFLAAGFEHKQALEVILGLALKTMSNFTNGLAGTPLDPAVNSYAWSKPTLRETNKAQPANA